MKFFLRIILYFFLITSCTQKNKTESEHAESEIHPEHENQVRLSAQQVKAAGVSVGEAALKNLSGSIQVSGTLAVPNQNKAVVTSLAGGVLKTLRVHPGDFVKKGQIIATIINTELSGLQQSLVSVDAQLRFARLEYDRMKELVEGNAAPLKSLQQAQADLNSLKAQKAALEKQLSVLGADASGVISSDLAIRAPVSGNISDIRAEIGSRIDADMPVAKITNLSELHLDLFVYEKDLPKISRGQTIHFTLTNNPGKEYDAVIYSIGTAFVGEAKAVPIHAHVINDKTGLIEGMSVIARISLSEDLFLAVPEESVVSHGGKDYIFVLEEHPEISKDHSSEKASGSGKGSDSLIFRRVQVIRGISDVGFTEIRPVEVIYEGTRIATQGAFFLMAVLANEGEGHEH